MPFGFTSFKVVIRRGHGSSMATKLKKVGEKFFVKFTKFVVYSSQGAAPVCEIESQSVANFSCNFFCIVFVDLEIKSWICVLGFNQKLKYALICRSDTDSL